MYDDLTPEQEEEKRLREAAPMSGQESLDAFSNISKYLPENPVEAPVPAPLPEEIIPQDQAAPMPQRDVQGIQDLLNAVKQDRSPSAIEEVKSGIAEAKQIELPKIETISEKDSEEASRMTDEIESMEATIAHPNTSPTDAENLQNTVNINKAAIQNMKGINGSQKSKETKAAEKLHKDLEVEANQFMDGEDSEAQDNLMKSLLEQEGLKNEIYRDSRKFPSIGIGHKLTKEERDSKVVDGIDISNGVNQEQASEILRNDISEATENVSRVLSIYKIDPESLSDEQRNALIKMNFQLGTTGQLKFNKMFQAIKAGDFKEAAKEAAINSKGGPSAWKEQTPKRVEDFTNGILPRESAPELPEGELPLNNPDLELLKELSVQQPDGPLDQSAGDSPGELQELQRTSNLPSGNPLADLRQSQDSNTERSPAAKVEEVAQDIEQVKAEIQDNAQDVSVDPIIQMRKDRDLKESLMNMMKYADAAARAYGGGSVTNIKADPEFYDDQIKLAGRPIVEELADRKRKEAATIAEMKKTILGDQVESSEKDSKISNAQRLKMESKYSKELKGIDLKGLSFNQLKKIEGMAKSGDKKGLTSYQQALLDYRNNRLDLSRKSLGLRDKKFVFQESEQDQKKVVSLSKAIGKEGIPEMNKNFSTFNDIVDKRGSSVMSQINRMTPSYLQELKGEKGSDIIKAKMALYSIINTVLKRRSGAAVTDSEYDRFLKEIGGGHLDSKGSVVEGIKFLQSKMKSVEDNINAGYDAETIKTFKSNQKRESKEEKVSKPNLSPKFLKANAGKSFTKNGIQYKIKADGSGLE